MNSSYLPEVIAIRHLRMRGKSTDPLHDQLRLSNILNSSDVRSRALPQSAILCIRKLRDPLPGTLRLDQLQRVSSAEWENATIGSIEQMAENASRPIFGSAPPNVEAVLFADRAEFLACLAMDLVDGVLTTNWWWKGIFHSEDITTSAGNAWLDDPEHMPAALQLLSLRGRAVPFLRSLSDFGVGTLLRRLMATFGLNEMERILDKSEIMNRRDGDSSMDEAQVDESLRPDSDRSQALLSVTNLCAPWQDWAPEVNCNGLDVDRQVLLGVGLMLQRAAEVVRRKSFARDLVAWRKSVLAHRHQDEGFAHTGEQAHLDGPVLSQQDFVNADAGTENKSSTPVTPGVAPAETEAGRTRSKHADPADNEPQLIRSDQLSAKAEVSVREPTNQSNEDAARVASSFERTVLTRRLPVPDHDGALAAKEIEAESNGQTTGRQESAEMVGLLGREIETKFGGVFYLINLGLLLGLYGDFTAPSRAGISMSIWDFLALVGRGLAGEDIVRDPIWTLLAELAGRQVHDPPGRGFRPSSSWRVPPHWLDAFPEEATCRWTSDGGRLRVRHPAGFLIIDVPTRWVNVLQQVKKELAPYTLLNKIRIRRGGFVQMPDEGGRVSQWVSWFGAYAQARLLRGLGAKQRRDVRRLVCLHEARIVVTPTRIDVEFSLEKLPIQLRLGGMDRDPGWVPAAGRFVSFQYR